MSILDSLYRFIDPVQHAENLAERRRKSELPPEVDQDDLDQPIPPRDDRRALLACRVCDHRGQDKYCPRCLADTMEPMRARP